MLPATARPLAPVTPPSAGGIVRPSSNALPRPHGVPSQSIDRVYPGPRRDIASTVVAAGSRDDAYANHSELRRGLEAQDGTRVASDEAMLDVLIATYGSGNGALSEVEIDRALTDNALRVENGVAWVDPHSPAIVDTVAAAVVGHGSRNDNYVNHDELRHGLEALGYEGIPDDRLLDHVIAEYGSGNGALSHEELGNALSDGVLSLGWDNSVAIDYRSSSMARRLADDVVRRGSSDDGYVNADELRSGLDGLGLDVELDDALLAAMIDRHGRPGLGAINASELTSAIVQGELVVNRDGEARIDPTAYDRIDDVVSHPISSFRDEVEGTEGQPVDRELARVAQAAYDPNARNIGGTPWSRLTETQLEQAGIHPAMLRDDGSSFKAGLYTDGHGRHVLAFAGTESFNPLNHDARQDWLNNFQQGTGHDARQYSEAVALARAAKAAFGDDLVITGHSLGGGLAGIAALEVDAPAVTFNPAGVHDRTLRREGLDPAVARADAAGGLVRQYVVEGEVLNHLQDTRPTSWIMPSAPGARIELPDPDPLNWIQRHVPGWQQIHSIQSHLMPAVLTAIDRRYPPDDGGSGRAPEFDAPDLGPIHGIRDLDPIFADA